VPPTATSCEGEGPFPSAGAIAFVSQQVTVTIAANQQVYVTASAELGPPDDFSAYTMQFFACYQDVTNPLGVSAIKPFQDEDSAQADGTVFIGTQGNFEFARSAATGTGELTAGDKYAFGLCAIETCISSGGGAWTNTYTYSNENTVGSSKVVAMVVVP
jgi:hypothetical protein